jgi:phytoene dehydrogenase-like protein
MTTINVVGGGLAGMVTAISATERGATVDLFEAHHRLGGRARSAQGEWGANWGPHALYRDGPLWDWLAARDLIPPVARPAVTGLRFRCDGDVRRLPPRCMLRSLAVLRARAIPHDRSFREWASERYGEHAAARWSSAAGVVTFCHDPGALAASFVAERLQRAFAVPSAARFPIGGWSSLVDQLETRMRALGVRVHTNAAVEQLPPSPVIVAVAPQAARRLLADDSIRWSGAHTALLDIGMRSQRGDAYIVSDLDEAGWVERFTHRDPTVAPARHELVQAQIGVRPGETFDESVTRIEALIDVGFPGWRAREVWRRRAIITAQSGSLDSPGYTWADRPAINRGDDVWLAGDYVAAPGLLAEVSWASALAAGVAAATIAHRAHGLANRPISTSKAVPSPAPESPP